MFPRILVFVLLVSSSAALAQTKPPVPVSEWGKWESVGPSELSPDGQWLAYMVTRSNGNHELRVSALAGGKNHTAAFGENPAFSPDSQWLAYLIGMHEDQQAKLRKDKKPVRKKLGLLKLASGEITTFDNIEAFAFSKAGAFLAMRHYAPERPGAAPPAEGAPPPEPPGVTLTVRDLAAAANSTFGNVSAFAWEDKGTLLAMTISTEGHAGNGVQLYDPASGALRVLDSAPAIYRGLAWRKDARDLAVLRVKTDERFEDDTCVLLAFRNAADKNIYDPSADAQFPAGKRVVKQRTPSWSEDGTMVFIGLADWEKKPPALVKKDDEEPAAVDVWHTADFRVIAEQKLRANRDRERSALAAWHLGPGRVVPLSHDPDEWIRTLKAFTIAASAKPYERDARFGREYWDVYRVDPATGQRTRLLEKIEWIRSLGPSVTGRYFAFVRSDHLWICDAASGKVWNATQGLPAAFVNREYDYPVAQKPPFGLAGWTREDRAVIVYDQYDLWELPTGGARPRRLTHGAAEHIEHRYLRLNPQEEHLELDQPLYLRLTGRWTKRSGFARLANGKVETLVYLDKQLDRLAKAKNADVYAWLAQGFDDSPDFFTAGADLKNPRQVSETNPFQQQYAWGRAELIDYQSPHGVRLQGALYYPAGYEPGQQYPMIVSIYEKRSQELHRYARLSERDYYSRAVYSALGYFVYLPDIVFRPRDPGNSIVECVTAAVKKVLEKGVVDPKRIGLTGHSWGGYGTVFSSTQTNVFAAAVAGAPLTNLSSSYGEIYWNTGIPETGHVETGQERMEVPLYEDPQAYVRNSATFAAHRMTIPLLIAHGDKDGACDLHQSIEMYNLARRAGKQVVLLVYAGENHGLASKPVQIDYQRRAREWFGHYLKGEAAPAWITRGVTFLEREKELKRLKDAKPAPAAPPPSTAAR
jgi:dipeptidyl aminopeptidase/acylaminoacyl peptidase